MRERAADLTAPNPVCDPQEMKTSEGEVKMAVIGDNPGPEEYLQHLNSFLRMLSRKKWDDEMTKLTKAVLTATARVRKLARTPNEETEPRRPTG